MEFAKALFGHDKNEHYFVFCKEDGFCFLVNGTNRPIEKPKKKNEKHIQIIKKLPKEVEEILKGEQTNLTIKQALKKYKQILNEEES